MAKLLSIVEVEANTGVILENFSFAVGGIVDSDDIINDFPDELSEGLEDFMEQCEEEGFGSYQLQISVKAYSYSEDNDTDEESENADEVLTSNFDELDYGLMTLLQETSSVTESDYGLMV